MEEPEPVIAYLLVVNPTLDVAIRSYVSEQIKKMKAPSSYRELFRPPLDHLFWLGQARSERNHTIRTARLKYGYKLSEIARAAWIHPSTASKIFRATRSLHHESTLDSTFGVGRMDWLPRLECDIGSESDTEVMLNSAPDPD